LVGLGGLFMKVVPTQEIRLTSLFSLPPRSAPSLQ
jgi:hypothetical protein